MKYFLLTVGICLSLLAFNQDNTNKDLFDEAKSHLVKYEMDKAIPLLESLLNRDMENANVRYLLGVCLSEQDHPGDRAIEMLSYGLDRIDQYYDPKSYKERDVPVYAYYFLTIALSKEGKCAEAVKAKDNFLAIYDEERNYYTEDIKRWCNKCLNKPEVEESTEPVVEVSVENKPIDKPVKEEPHVTSITTKNVAYSTPTPLYGVQIGAFSKFYPSNEFNYYRNVSAYLDNKGMVRYVIGVVTFKSQAERILEAAKQNGISDAFIVDINKTRKYKEEIISFNRQSLKANATGVIDYRVQIGAFSNLDNQEVNNIYFGLRDVMEYEHSGLTMITTGSFEEYKEAKIYLEMVKKLGFVDAFLVAFMNNDRITMEEATQREKQRRFENSMNKKK